MVRDQPIAQESDLDSVYSGVPVIILVIIIVVITVLIIKLVVETTRVDGRMLPMENACQGDRQKEMPAKGRAVPG